MKKKIKLIMLLIIFMITIFSFAFKLNANIKNDEQKKEEYLKRVFYDFNVSGQEFFYTKHNNKLKNSSNYALNKKTNNDNYAIFNEDGELIEFQNIKNIDTPKKQKYKTVEDTINMLYKQKYLDDSYELYMNKTFLGEKGRSLLFIKKEETNVKNRYNSISLKLDNKTNNIISYKKIELYNKIIDPVIKKSESVTISNEFLKKRFEKLPENKPNVILSVEYTNDFFYADRKHELKTVYVVDYSDIIVYVDAENGNIVGGDMYKKDGNSFYTTNEPAIRESAENINLLMKELGYNTSIYNVNDFPNGKNIIHSYLKNLNSFAFNFSGHGSATSISKGTTDKTYLTPAEMRKIVSDGSYMWNFVFLDACKTGETPEWAQSFNIYDGNNQKLFLGWFENVGIYTAKEYTELLLQSVRQNPYDKFYNNVWRAINASETYFPIRFYGDYIWNGRV